MQLLQTTAARTSEPIPEPETYGRDRTLNTSTGVGRNVATGIQTAVEPGRESEFSTGSSITSRLSAYTTPALLLGISAVSFLGSAISAFSHKHPIAGLIELGLAAAMGFYSYTGWNAPAERR